MTDTTIAVVGALGMTGRAIAARLAEREAPTVLIGRRKDALAELACSLPGAQARPVDVTHHHDLIEALACVGVVASCVGPYSELGWRVAQAALVAGAHYSDVSGEPEWVLRLLNKIDASARSQSLIFVPACGASAVLGDVADATGPVRSVDIVYRVAGLHPSPATAASYAHIFAGRAIQMRSAAHWPTSVGASRRALPGGAGLDLPVCDLLVIYRWLDGADVSGYLRAPVAQVTRHAARAASTVRRRPMARRLLDSGYGRLVSGDARSGALTVDAIVTTPTDQAVFRSIAQDLYFTTSGAAAAVARRLTEGGDWQGGLTAPTQELGDLDAEVLAGVGSHVPG
jgi:short subunit dehydrogenase-like uncharacterized protein